MGSTGDDLSALVADDQALVVSADDAFADQPSGSAASGTPILQPGSPLG